MPFSLNIFTIFAIGCAIFGAILGNDANGVWLLNIDGWVDQTRLLATASVIAVILSIIGTVVACLVATDVYSPSHYSGAVGALICSAIASFCSGFNFGLWSGALSGDVFDFEAWVESGWPIMMYIATATPILLLLYMRHEIKQSRQSS